MAKAPGHPFYERVNKVLGKAGFDDFVEQRCAQFYAAGMGRPSLAPGIYFRLLLVGYFEGLDSERGMAWRAADWLALREFLGLKLSESPPDHSTISRTRRLIDVETHEAVFSWVLKQLGESGLLKGKTIGIDATTLEANAADVPPVWRRAIFWKRAALVGGVPGSEEKLARQNCAEDDPEHDRVKKLALTHGNQT